MRYRTTLCQPHVQSLSFPNSESFSFPLDRHITHHMRLFSRAAGGILEYAPTEHSALGTGKSEVEWILFFSASPPLNKVYLPSLPAVYPYSLFP
jgi:hypothetical protein